MSLAIKAGRAYTRQMGDPGLGSFLKKAVGTVANVAGSILPGPIGAIAKLGATALGVGTAAKAAGSVIQRVSTPAFNPTVAQPMPDIALPGLPSTGIHLPGGAPGVGIQIGPRTLGLFPSAGEGGPPRGYRLNKSDYFLRDGTFVPKGTRYVRARRRNPLNPRALDRAMSRMVSAKKASEKIGRISIRKAKSCR